MPNVHKGKDFSFIRIEQGHNIPNEKTYNFASNNRETNPEKPLLMEIPEEKDIAALICTLFSYNTPN
jgi:hypothetical protein